MSSLNQNSVDDLLKQMQADTDVVKANATPDAAGAINDIAKNINNIAGEMEPAPGHTAQLPHASSTTEAGEHYGAPSSLSSLPPSDVHRLLSIEVPVIVQMGIRRMTVGEVMRLGVGVIVEFGKSAEEELELLANNKSIGKGHAVKVGENFGIKVSKIGSVKETIRKLGGM